MDQTRFKLFFSKRIYNRKLKIDIRTILKLFPYDSIYACEEVKT